MRKTFWALLLCVALLIPVVGNTKVLNQVWRMGTTGNLPSWGPVNLGSANAVSSVLPVVNGGTGTTTLNNILLTTTAAALRVIRGTATTDNTGITAGEGFTLSAPALGKITATFTTPFTGLASCVCTFEGSSDLAGFCKTNTGVSPTSTAQFKTFSSAASLTDAVFNFVCVGKN